MGSTPFETIASNLGAAFSVELSTATSNGLAAVATPLTAAVVLWVIIQGALVIRGDIDTRSGVTQIIRIAIVFGLLTSVPLYTSYVQNLFQTVLPNWAASSMGGGGVASTPETFDQIWNTTMHQILVAESEVSWNDITDQVCLALIALGVTVILVITFAVYELAQGLIAIVLAVGPFVLGGYLFNATRRVAENWVGKMVGLMLLTLMINIALVGLLRGDEMYMRSVLSTPGATVQQQVVTLFELCMFIGISGFIVTLLPGVAVALGGGISVYPGGLLRSATSTIMSGTRGVAGAVGGGSRGALSAAGDFGSSVSSVSR